MDQLYSAMSPQEVDVSQYVPVFKVYANTYKELIYCDCDDFEIRAEKVINLIRILKEGMDRQTELVKAVDALQ